MAGHPGVSATQPQKSSEVVPMARTFQWAQEVVATKKVPQKSPIIPQKRHRFLQQSSMIRKGPYICAKKNFFHRGERGCGHKEAPSEEPYNSAKETDISAKGLNNSAKEPYVLAEENCIFKWRVRLCP